MSSRRRIIFWYWVRFCRACSLKKSTLCRLNESVTLTLSSRYTNSSGPGRKSLTTLSSPIGSLVYLIFFFIDLSTFSPVSGTEDPYLFISVDEPNRHDPVADFAKTIISVFSLTVLQILGNYTSWIGKSILSKKKRDAVLCNVLLLFFLVPFEIH